MSFQVPSEYRVQSGHLRTTAADGNNGWFFVHSVKFKKVLRCLASDGMGWEHVSVTVHGRCPSWLEMCHVKRLFWGPDDVVVQIHPPEAEYVNNHKHCLHLFRKAGTNDFLERPPAILVGVPTTAVATA